MADKRDRVIRLAQYIEGLGVKVNLGKTKARGNKGIFLSREDVFRIDISKNIDETSALSTLLHEFAHFIHYKHDKTLKSLDFVFKNLSEDEYEELLNVTVKNIPKDFASSLYKRKKQLSDENRFLAEKIKSVYPDFKLSEPHKKIEFGLIFGFGMNDIQNSYIKLKSNQKNIAKINARINKLNKYYNQPSELWARFFELFFTDELLARKIAPNICNRFCSICIPEVYDIAKIINM